MGHVRTPIPYVPSFGQRRRSLRPPNLPRFAAGLPSTSTRSRAKSIVGALLKLVPTPNPSTPASSNAGIDVSSTEPETKIFTSLCPRRSSSQRTSRTIAAKFPRREAGMHASHAEREDLLSVRELSNPSRLGRNAARLADHPEDRRFVKRPLLVRAFEGQDGDRDAPGSLRWEETSFRERPHAHILSRQEMHNLLEAAEDPPRPPIRQGASRDLGDDVRAAPTCFFQDVEGPRKVDVRGPSRPDLVRRGDVEVTCRRGLGHFSRSGYFLRLLELLAVACAVPRWPPGSHVSSIQFVLKDSDCVVRVQGQRTDPDDQGATICQSSFLGRGQILVVREHERRVSREVRLPDVVATFLGVHE